MITAVSYVQMCWQWCVNGSNNSQQCCGDLQYLVGRIQPIRLCKLKFDSHLGACVASTMLEELCKRIQHCCTTLWRSRNKRNVSSCWLKRSTRRFQTLRSNNSQQHATGCGNGHKLEHPTMFARGFKKLSILRRSSPSQVSTSYSYWVSRFCCQRCKFSLVSFV